MMIWHDTGRMHYYLIPENQALPPGDFPIASLTGARQHVAPAALLPFEVTEVQARRWARDQLGRTLDELKLGIDDRMAAFGARLDELKRTAVADDPPLSATAPLALLDLLKQLPSVVAASLSNDPDRLASSRSAMLALQRRLQEAGIELDERFGGFPDRLAELRKDFERQTAGTKGPPDRS